jgi:signal transduction histidine kinase
MHNVFDRFVRGDDSRNRGRSGHGLGLSICREIVRAHGGELILNHSKTGWTEFQVSLPMVEASVPSSEPAEMVV